MLFFNLLSFYFLPFLFIIPFLFIFFSLTTYTKKPYKNPPPSPPKLPISGNLHLLRSLPHHSLRSLSQKHGPLMLLHLGNVPVLVVSSSIAAREIMKTHDQIFSSRPKPSIIGNLTYGFKDIAFSPYGKYWRQVRSIGVIHLLSNKMVQSFRNVREEETALMIEKIKHFSSSSPFSSSVNLSDMFVKLTNDIVCRVALGRRYSGGERKDRRIKKLFTALMELTVVFNVGDYISWLGWLNRFNGLDGKVKKYVKEMDDFLEEVLEDHIVDGNRSEGNQDFVDILLEIQRENKDGSSPVNRDTIKAVTTGVVSWRWGCSLVSSRQWVLPRASGRGVVSSVMRFKLIHRGVQVFIRRFWR
ncbi:Cytochrome P450 71A2 [Camellia lanceoleosa]|uniref:Cytochrome P450 71A2 n=1 Tax=Camellia lanceoleosa TaxID=1840588 RepID=A0ACC0HG81_9ERIC|nr:Cytochrome P450 71A2 [Camellia lanceoleosa]